MRVAAVQLDVALADVPANLAASEALARAAARAGAEAIALPEFFTTGAAFVSDLAGAALAPDGAATAMLLAVAREEGALVGGSFLCRDEDGEVRNAFFLAGPDGLLGRHDKDLPTMWENALYVGGTDDGVIAAGDRARRRPRRDVVQLLGVPGLGDRRRRTQLANRRRGPPRACKRPAEAGRCHCDGALVLDGLHVRRARALGALLGLVGDLCALGERLVAVTDDRGVMDEQVLALVVGRDEAEALVVAEPFNGSSCHGCSLPGVVCCETREMLWQQLQRTLALLRRAGCSARAPSVYPDANLLVNAL
jgi:carbon-nitrogen hydrolase